MMIRVCALPRPRLLRAVLCLFITLGACVPAQAQRLKGLDLERCREMLRGVKSEIKRNYYDTNFRGMDIEARFKAAEQKLEQAESLGQGMGIIAQVLIELDDSHTFFIPPRRASYTDYGWHMQMIGDAAYVVAVKPGSDAEAKGLKVGDRVIAVDGFGPTRADLWKMRYMYYTLRPRPGMKLIVQSPGGQEREVIALANVRQGKRVMDLSGGDGGSDIWQLIRESEVEDRLDRQRFYDLGADALIWKMPSFAVSETEIDTMMDKVRNRKGLVLDLRGNAGGYVVALERLVGYFFERDIKIGDLKGRKEKKPQIAKTRGDKVFKGKLVVLIDHESGSAAELFARVMQLEKRGVVIGDTSAGAVMQSLVHGRQIGADTVSFYAVSVTDADVIMADGKSLEHAGVVPDETLLPTGADLAAQRDPVLARAATLLGIHIPAAQAGKLFPVEWRK